MIEITVRAALLASAAATALVGNRVHSGIAPPGTPTPYITYQTVIGLRDATMAIGMSKTRRVRLQLDGWADNEADAQIACTAGARAIVDCAALQAVFLSDQPARDPATKLYRFMIELSIWKMDS